MDIGIFQLLPQPEGRADHDVLQQALWEVDFAEANGFSSIWVTEHHLSSFGLIGAPSAYAAAIAQRTRRVEIGYAVAVVPLHHPLRLAEEIAWVDQLSGGRLKVGVGPGFSAYEFGALGVPLAERHERLEEGLAVLRGALEQPVFVHAGRYWRIPPVTLKPRPFRGTAPPFLRASSGMESLRRAARDGMPIMLGVKPLGELAERIATFRALRAERGVPPAQVDREVAEFRVLRRISIAETKQEARAGLAEALDWEARTARRVHDPDGVGALADGSAPADLAGVCVGTPDTVLGDLGELAALGIQHVIAWVHFGDLEYHRVRRTMGLLARDVLPRLRASTGLAAAGGGQTA
jgi:alkanesulfonate monooxygenase SsuD/methylene tetrahydromethanopterin reductase-like flavin-dependent oxidoreductase (luciferase family)